MTEFYRKKNPNTGVDNFYETGTNRYISATEFGKGAGFTEQTNPTTQTQPSTIRTTEGGLANLTTPLDKWKSDTAFMEQAKSIIQKKQNYNKDIANQKLYWRDKAKSSPFFSDDESIMRTLSPGEQASVKLSRYNTAQSHLQGLGEEEVYRETRTEDIINSLKDMMAERDKMDKTTADNYSRTLNDMLKKQKLEIPITDKEYNDVGLLATNGKLGGSISWRNNNPSNLKYSAWQKKYGATKDPNSNFSVYPDVKSAQNAYKALLTSPNGAYSGLSLNDAMWKWSGGGKDTQPSYTYGDLIKLGAPDLLELNMKGMKGFKDFGEEEWNKFFAAQQQKEGWNPNGIILSEQKNSGDAQYVADLLEIPIEDYNNFSEAEKEMSKKLADSIATTGSKTELEKAKFDEMDKFVADEKAKGTDPNLIEAALARMYANIFNSEERGTALINAGATKAKWPINGWSAPWFK